MQERSPFEWVADYRLLEHLGSGGFADTYRAEKDGEEYAVKVLRELPMGNNAVRFEREVETLRLEHANIVSYVDSGIDSYGGLRRPYIVMPFLPGKTLRQTIDSSPQPLAVAEVVRIGIGVAAGLAFLHERNIAHRDLNPKNIYLCESGEVLILDFGLVKLLDHTSLTLPGQLVGTLAYCAPEQLRNESDLHTDLYALGATLFHAVCGRPPFLASSHVGFVEMIRAEDPEPLSVLNPATPDGLERLILALLAKEPVQRPASASEVATALRAPDGAVRVDPLPYNRDSNPILAVRATTTSAARAIVGAAMLGESPQVAMTAITTPRVLEDVVRAAGFDPNLELVIDTRVESTAAIGMAKTVGSRRFAPANGEPYRHADLRAAETSKRVARGDLFEQDREGASILRSACFRFSRPDDDWVKRDARLLGDALAARDAINAQAPLYATVRCQIDALLRGEDRLAVANRFSRGAPDGFWLEVYDLSIHSHPEAIASVMEMLLLLQERGVSAIASLPGPLVELAWSIGVAGAEVKLGRVGGAHAPSARARLNADLRSRFELLSVFASFVPEDAVALLERNVLPESSCGCPTCRLGGTYADRVANADSHDIFAWRSLQRELSDLAIPERLERLENRLADAERLLTETRGTLPKGRGSRRHLTTLRATLARLSEHGVHSGFGAIRR